MDEDDESTDEVCELCGSDESVGEDPNGEFLCRECADEIWF